MTRASEVFRGGGGQFYGAAAPRKGAGKLFWPPHMYPELSGGGNAKTAGRYYIAPFIVEKVTVFAGAWTYNKGTGSNGYKIKIAAYAEDVDGGAGALAKDFGEVTLTGAEALRQFASSWTATPGVYYLYLVSDSAPSMFNMNAVKQASAAGMILPNVAANTLGVFVGNFAPSSTNGEPTPQGDYVDGTYANFPEAIALAPTNTITSANTFPLMGLYT